MDSSIQAHYARGVELPRLTSEPSLELVRTQELLERYLPPAPASVLDVGGGPGVYAAWLAARGYSVRLVDPVPLHIEQALAASDAQPASRFEAVEGDARSLQEPDVAYDAVLLMGPLYHLIERADRVRALEEARRVARPGGRVIAVVISRFASYLDGLRRGWLRDPLFSAMADEDLRSGQHRNPEPERRPDWFTTAYLHRPEEVSAELWDAGLTLQALVGIEGLGWLVHDGDVEECRRAASMLEHEPSLLGVSAHLMAIATRPRD